MNVPASRAMRRVMRQSRGSRSVVQKMLQWAADSMNVKTTRDPGIRVRSLKFCQTSSHWLLQRIR